MGAGVLSALLGMGVGLGVDTGGAVTGGSVAGGSVGGIDMAFSCSVSPTKILSGRVASLRVTSLRVVRRCTTSSCMYILQKGEGVSREEITDYLYCLEEVKNNDNCHKDICAHLGEYRRHLGTENCHSGTG